jgi:hypothetical protein
MLYLSTKKCHRKIDKTEPDSHPAKEDFGSVIKTDELITKSDK